MASSKTKKGPTHELTDMDVQFVSMVNAGANRQTQFLMVKSAGDGTIIPEIADVDKANDESEEKSAGSPRNRYGTHSSFGFKGGYAKAWRVYFSKWADGRSGAAATSPIQCMIRRVAMIAAAKQPPHVLPGAETVSARSGDPSPLTGTFPEKSSDYGLDQWDKAETDGQKEGVKLSGDDLTTIKTEALAEIKKRADDATARQKEQAEEHGIEILGEKLGPDDGEPTDFDLYGDPVNFKYPMALEDNSLDAARITEELTRFKADHETYAEGARAVVLERIVRTALAAGAEVSFDEGDTLGAMLPQDLKDELKKSGDPAPDGDGDGDGDDQAALEADMSAWLDTAGQNLDESLLAANLEQQLRYPRRIERVVRQSLARVFQQVGRWQIRSSGDQSYPMHDPARSHDRSGQAAAARSPWRGDGLSA